MIEIRNLSKEFSGQLIWENVSFDIEDGARTCVVGGSGCGKSVLIKHVLGLLSPTTGTIVIDGKDTSGFSQRDWNELMKDFGVVFQGAALFDSLTVLENVGIRLYEEKVLDDGKIREMVVDSLKKVDLDGSILHKYPSEISGGMRKRVGIARAIIHNPTYLVYDEPTTGLDPVSSDTIDNLMHSLSYEQGRTSIIITHDMFTVKSIASQVIMLHEQAMLFSGTPQEFISSDIPRIREFLNRTL